MKYIQSCIVIALSSVVGLNGIDSGKEARISNLFGAENFSCTSEYYKAIKGENKDLAIQCCALGGMSFLAIALTEGDTSYIAILENAGLSYTYLGAISVPENKSIQKLTWQNGVLFALNSEGALLTWENPVSEAVSSEKTIQKVPTVLSLHGYYLWSKKTHKSEEYGVMAFTAAFVGIPLLMLRAFTDKSADPEGLVGAMACAMSCIWGYKAYKHAPAAAQSWSDFIKDQKRVLSHA